MKVEDHFIYLKSDFNCVEDNLIYLKLDFNCVEDHLIYLKSDFNEVEDHPNTEEKEAVYGKCKHYKRTSSP